MHGPSTATGHAEPAVNAEAREQDPSQTRSWLITLKSKTGAKGMQIPANLTLGL